DILTAVKAGESSDWEFKAARTDLPGTVWETISVMANTDGGAIVLGIRETDHAFTVEGVQNAAKLKQDFWNNANNPQKINRCTLRGDDVTVEVVEGKQLVVLRVPRASRKERPIYIGSNPLNGTFRRFNEGDYKCPPDEVGRMLADQA